MAKDKWAKKRAKRLERLNRFKERSAMPKGPGKSDYRFGRLSIVLLVLLVIAVAAFVFYYYSTIY